MAPERNVSARTEYRFARLIEAEDRSVSILRSVEFLLMFEKLGSHQAVARSRCISRTRVTESLNRLESALELSDLQGIVAGGQAGQLLREAERFLEAGEAFISTARRTQQGEARSIRFGSFSGPLGVFVAAAVGAVAREYPENVVRLPNWRNATRSVQAATLLDQLERDLVDYAVIPFLPDEHVPSSGFESTELRPFQFGVIGSGIADPPTGRALQIADIVSLAKSTANPIFVGPPGYMSRRLLENECRRQQIELPERLFFDYPDNNARAAAGSAGLGIAIVFLDYLDRRWKTEAVVPLGPREGFRFELVWRTDESPESLWGAALHEFVVEAFTQHAQRLSD